jgi:hypothetical protein
VLVPYSLDLSLRLTCDASEAGAGAVLSHVMPDGEKWLVCYASKIFTQAERGYARVEREASAIIYGIIKYHKYLWGREFELATSHSSLTTIFGPRVGVRPLAAARLHRRSLVVEWIPL